MIPPNFNNKVKKCLNPDVKTLYRSGEGGYRHFDKKINKVQSPLFDTNNKEKSFRARDQCGSVASGLVTTNIATKQGIPTSNKFAALMEVPQEDDCVSSQDESSSCLSNSHDSHTTPTRTIVSVTSRSLRVPTTASGLNISY